MTATLSEMLIDMIREIVAGIAIAAFSVVLTHFFTKQASSAKIKKLEEMNRQQNNRILELEKENKALKNKLMNFTELSLKNSIYYDRDGNPFCPACRGNSRFVPLVEYGRYRDAIQYQCPNCKISLEAPFP